MSGKLTKVQFAALKHAATSVFGYAGHYPDTKRTYESLERRGLVVFGRSAPNFHGTSLPVWRITEAGRSALHREGTGE